MADGSLNIKTSRGCSALGNKGIICGLISAHRNWTHARTHARFVDVVAHVWTRRSESWPPRWPAVMWARCLHPGHIWQGCVCACRRVSVAEFANVLVVNVSVCCGTGWSCCDGAGWWAGPTGFSTRTAPPREQKEDLPPSQGPSDTYSFTWNAKNLYIRIDFSIIA